MTFKDSEEVIEAIKKVVKVPDWVNEAREYHKTLKALMYGEGFKDEILRIEHIETTKKAIARNKYSRSIKDTNAKLLEPVGNVYSATGGRKEYVIKPETSKSEFLRMLSNIRGGLSLERWLETYWAKDLYIVDPSGVIMLEASKEEDDNLIAYPTYKSIDVIQDYKANGQNLEYIIYSPFALDPKIRDAKSITPDPNTTPTSDKKIWRVVDDARDYMILQDRDQYSELVEGDHISMDHEFQVCPGRINSDKCRLGSRVRLSPIDSIMESEIEFMRDRSILTIHKFLNGFSTPYKPKIICEECRGSGKVGAKGCENCDGKGFIGNTDVVDEIIIPIDLQSENPPPLPSNFAGFISPDLKIWDQYRKEGELMFDEMFETLWGTRETEAKDQTAVGMVLNTQPMRNRLNSWSESSQSQEHFFTECLANYHLPNKDPEMEVSIISYGRDYIIQPPEFLLSEYQKSRAAKDGTIILDRKLIEYITSKYKNDPVTLGIELKKMHLEPYVHMDILTINMIFGNGEARKKGWFADWWESLNPSDYYKTEEQLEKMRDQYFTEMSNLVPELTPEPQNQK